MRRARPDPRDAAARLAGVVPQLASAGAGWVPPPAVEPAEEQYDEPGPSPVRSWAAQGTESDEPSLGLLAGFVPEGLRGGRWDPGRRGLGVLAVVALVAALIAGFVLIRSRPHEETPPPSLAVSAGPSSGPGVVVDVAGRVRHPGLVRLPFGARVDDAIRAAGGPLPDASYDGLNRARKLTDGEQVLVGVPAAAGSAASSGADARVDINLADVAALDALPGIGPVLAQKIVDWRTEHGRFASVDQLREVGGIGESKFAALKNKVRA